MAVAFVQEYKVDAGGDRSTVNYDYLFDQLNLTDDPPDGLIAHTAGFDEDQLVFRIFDVWDSLEQVERFLSDRLSPLLASGTLPNPDNSGPPDRQYFYELHSTVTP
jgi:hypothetical protein